MARNGNDGVLDASEHFASRRNKRLIAIGNSERLKIVTPDSVKESSRKAYQTPRIYIFENAQVDLRVVKGLI